MLKKAIRTVVAIAFMGVLATTISPARADIYVYYDLDGATLDYKVAGGATTVEDEGGTAAFFMLVKDSGSIPNTIKDSVTFDPGHAGFEFLISMTLSGSGESWSATGTWTLKAGSGPTTYVDATFTSTDVRIDPGAGFQLVIEGFLSPTSGSTILVGGGDPWVLPGDGDFYPTHGYGNSDSTDNQITVSNAASYDGGTLTSLHFGVGTSSLATLFSEDRTLVAGDVDGTITPVPAALVLGLVGLGLVGLWARRYA